MTGRYSIVTALVVIFLSGCAHQIDVQHYPFGSPMHHAENGIAFINMGFSEDAMREFDTALGDNPKFSPALAGKGVYWALADMPDVAEGYIILARRYAIQDSEKIFALLASMRVSLIVEDDGWFERLTRDYNEIIAVAPNNDRALYWMGVASMKVRQLENARKAFKKVIELDGMYKRKAEKYLKEIK